MTPGSDFSPFESVVPTTKAVAASIPQEKINPTITSDPVLLLKPPGTCRLQRDVSTQGHPFKIGIGN